MTAKDSDTPSTESDESYSRRIQSDESHSIGIVRTVSALKNTPALELEPLSESLDPGALDRLLRQNDGVSVEFEYEGLRVAVDGRTVTVRETTEP
ncbi:HalOD1 output domain-containing protein [Halosimplex salinum]|uniref:HalOD1 output domain-containing protein n=1 Tax=Halosimplex salinum TaxID=1710538 RepID=UPI0019D0577B|nr:HalOD1 output domain-containing protein [Halosimplex salinum]